jgi:hypothetical protein
MKSKIFLCSILLLTLIFLSFIPKNKISNCFLSFTTATNLTAASPDRLPDGSEKFWSVTTDSGEVNVSRMDGYRILYNNVKKVPFVNLKVELSDPKSYESDQKKLLDNLKYLNSRSPGMETGNIITLEFNGYKIYGLSRGSIEKGSTLGTFMMFPGNNVIVYFYFNNLKPEYRNFDSLDDYKKQRDQFIEEYTKYLLTCKDK